MSERRRSPRFLRTIPARVWFRATGERAAAGSVTDLSAGGAYIVVPGPVVVGEKVRLAFRVDGVTDCDAAGFVMRGSPSPKGHGAAVAFARVSATFRAFIEELTGLHDAARPSRIAAIDDLQIWIG